MHHLETYFAPDVAKHGAAAMARVTSAMGAWRAPVLPNFKAPTKGEPLPVVANHGRWIVECPCGNAQLASREDHRFLCDVCGNAYQDGAFRPTEWPKHADRIGALLDARPRHLANMEPGETVDDISSQNRVLGVTR